MVNIRAWSSTPKAAASPRLASLAASFLGALTLLQPSAKSVAERLQAPPDAARPVSVLVLDFAGDGYQLTSTADGVQFDIDGTGQPVRVAWTARASGDAFLFLDTDGNGRVDGGHELLGNGWRSPNTPRAPSVDRTLIVIQGYPLPPPTPLPEGIGTIDARDAVFNRLRVWRDVNHDGRSQPNEMQTLAQSEIVEILLAFRNLRREIDEIGNIRQNEGTFLLSRRGVPVTRRMLDVVLARTP